MLLLHCSAAMRSRVSVPSIYCNITTMLHLQLPGHIVESKPPLNSVYLLFLFAEESYCIFRVRGEEEEDGPLLIPREGNSVSTLSYMRFYTGHIVHTVYTF